MVNNSELARQFVQGATKGKGSHMFIDGDTIYSYGYHFPVAVRTKDGYLFNSSGYSSTTAKHKSYVNRALPSDKTFLGRTDDLKNLEKNASAEKLRAIDENTKKYISESEVANKKFKSDRAKSQRALKKGTQIEMEHTTDKYEAEKIARDHLKENLDYYKFTGKKGKEYIVTSNELKSGDVAYGKGLLSSPDTDYHKKIGVVKNISGDKVTVENKGREEVYDKKYLTVSRRVPSSRRGSRRHTGSRTRISSGSL